MGNMLKVTCCCLFISGLLHGCAGPIGYSQGPSNLERGKVAFAEGRWETAYRFLEDPTPSQKDEAVNLIRGRSEVVAAGATTFTTIALNASIQKYGKQSSFEIERKRLELFKRYGSVGQIEAAELSFGSVFPEEIKAAEKERLERERVAKLPEKEQNKYWADQYKKWEESVTVFGRVMGAQLIDESQKATKGGAQLGALVGQAAYIDSTNIYNYSAMNQITAGILGGVLGGLADRQATTSFRKVYFVKTSGGVKRIDHVDSSQVLYPVGACISFREPFLMQLASESYCKD